MSSHINWDVSTRDFSIIEQIADRAVVMARQHRIQWTKQDFMMDVTAVYNRDGLRLADLLAADDFNFAHDILGIRRHLNRDTGKLSQFVPRFARFQ